MRFSGADNQCTTIQTSVRCYPRFNSRFDLPRTLRLAMLNPQCGAVPQFALFIVPRPISTGAHMKLSIVFKNVDRHNPAEKQLQQCADKLSKLLKNYDPDLVQLHVEPRPAHGHIARYREKRASPCRLQIRFHRTRYASQKTSRPPPQTLRMEPQTPPCPGPRLNAQTTSFLPDTPRSGTIALNREPSAGGICEFCTHKKFLSAPLSHSSSHFAQTLAMLQLKFRTTGA
jgi:hypothetical protein